MDRRSFLIATGTLALGQILAGCGNQNQATLNVKFLKGSVPNPVVKAFRNANKQAGKLNFSTVAQLKDLFKNLQSWQQNNKNPEPERAPFLGISLRASTNPPDLVTLGDYWLAAAIEQKLIQSFDPTALQLWSKLPQRWQELVTRNDQGEKDPQGKVWAAPYRWGYTMIVYNRDKFKSLGWQPKDWDVLWREELRDRISLLNHPREIIGLTLKTLGKSYNTENLSQVPDLKQQLDRLKAQVKFYSSDTYLQPLILEDTWLAVGWSNDLLPIIQRYRQFDGLIPASGTALWADLWVLPTGNTNQALNQKWIDFCWQPQVAQQISLLSKASSPIPVELNPANIQAELQHLLIPNEQILQRSEFLLPLSQETRQQYQSLWQEIRG